MRIKKLLCALSCAAALLCSSVQGQTSKQIPDLQDKLDSSAYKFLFGKVLSAMKTDRQDSRNASGNSLTRFSQRLELDSGEVEILKRIAINYEKEITPLRKEALDVATRFQSRFPDGIVHAGMDASPPPELEQLRVRQEQTALKHRDQLQHFMSEQSFRRIQSQVQELYRSATPTTGIQSSPQF